MPLTKATQNVIEGIVSTGSTGISAGSFIVGQQYKITSLGTTTQSQWNTIAGTTGQTYVVGSLFMAATTGASSGNGAAAVARTLADRFADVVNVLDFGAVGNGVADDTAAIQAFFNALGTGKVGDIGGGQTFLFTQISIPSNVNLRGNSVFRSNGSTVIGSQVTIAGSFTAEALNFTTVGTETNFDFLIFTGSNYEIGSITLKSDTQRTGTGGITLGNTTSNFWCGKIETKNIARPIAVGGGVNPSPHTSNIHFGDISIDTYIRGIYFYNCRNWSIRNAEVKGKDSRASVTPGHNAILIEASKDFQIGSLQLEDSGEHTFRIGGSQAFLAGSQTERGTIGSIYSRNAGACGVKINPANSGCSNVSINEIIVLDCGRDGVATIGYPAGNQDGLRISDAQDTYIGSCAIYATGLYSSNHCVNLNSITNLVIGNLVAESPYGNILKIDKNIDTATGNFDGLFIHAMTSNQTNAAAVSFVNIEYLDGLRTIGNIFIRNITASGNYNFIIQTTEAIIQSGKIFISGVANGLPANFNLSSGCTIDFHLTQSGRLLNGTSTAAISDIATYTAYGSTAFDSNASVTRKGSIFVDATPATAGLNSFAGSIAFSRPASARRGAAVAAKQTGSNAQQIGLSFFTGNPPTVGSDLVAENMILKHTGVLNLANLPTSSAGLVTGDLWRNGNVINIV